MPVGISECVYIIRGIVHYRKRVVSSLIDFINCSKRLTTMPQPTKAIISNEQKSGIRKGSNRASTGKVGALLLSVYIV